MNRIKKKIYNIQKDKKVIASNYLSLFVLQIANYLLPLLVLPFLVRILGTEKFGLVMFAQALILFLTIFVDFGFNLSGTREISIARDNKDKLSEIFSAIMFIKICLIIVAFTILFIVVNVFTRFRIDSEIYYLTFGIVIGQALFPVWFFQGIEKMKFITLINITAKLIFTLLVFVFIRQQSDYIFVPVYNSLGFIVSGIIGFLFCFRYVKVKIPSFYTIKRLLKESSILYVSNFATSLYTASNVFILGIFAGNSIAGIYASMEKLILAIKNIYSPFYQALYPWLSKQKDNVKIRTIKKIKPLILLLSVLITIVILLFGNTLLLVIYDNKLITNYAIIFKLLSLISIFSALNMLYNTLYFPSIKKYKIRMNILISGGVFNLFISLILVYYFGIYGTAFSVVSTELFLLILGIYFFNKTVKIKKEANQNMIF